MGQMQRDKRMLAESRGRARRKVLEVEDRRLAPQMRAVAALAANIMPRDLVVYMDEAVPVDPAWFDVTAKTFDKRITPP